MHIQGDLTRLLVRTAFIWKRAALDAIRGGSGDIIDAEAHSLSYLATPSAFDNLASLNKHGVCFILYLKMSLPHTPHSSSPIPLPRNYPSDGQVNPATPPPPPPKPLGHESNRSSFQPPPPSTPPKVSLPDRSDAEMGIAAARPTSTPHEPFQPNNQPQPPRIEDGWFPDVLNDKSYVPHLTLFSLYLFSRVSGRINTKIIFRLTEPRTSNPSYPTPLSSTPSPTSTHHTPLLNPSSNPS